MAYSPERFDALVAEIRARSEEIMLAKRGEYSPNADRLQNFRTVAAFTGRRPSEVALTYFLKHVQAITEAVRSRAYAWCWQREDGSEGLKQRFADGINYLYLLAACVDEEVGE